VNFSVNSRRERHATSGTARHLRKWGKTITEDRRLSHPDKEITLYELRLGTAYATARCRPRLHLTSAAQLRDVHAHQSKTRSPTLPIPNEGGLDYDTNDGS
jgi:hypothetical protein